MENRIHFQVVTAGGPVFDKMVNYVAVPLTDGEAGILADHAAMLASLKEAVATRNLLKATRNLLLLPIKLTAAKNLLPY